MDSPEKPHPHMWDALEHILFFVNLIVLFASISLILDFFIDKWFPTLIDIATDRNNQYLVSISNSLLRLYIAGMLVSYPIFSFLLLKITKRMQTCPEIHTIRSRKAVIYLSLFISLLTIIGSSIMVVYNFINGGITLNFILHFLVTLIINLGILIYFLNQISIDKKAYAQ